MPAQQFPRQRHEISGAAGLPPRGRGGGKVRHNERAAQQPIQERLNRGVGFDNRQGVHGALRGQFPVALHVLEARELIGAQHRRVKSPPQFQRGNAGPALFIRVQITQDPLRGVRLFGQDDLQVMAQRRFNRRHVTVGHADFVRQRTEHLRGLVQRRQCSGAESLVLHLQLFEHVEAGFLFRLLLQLSVKHLRGFGDGLLDFPQTILSLLHRTAARLRAELLGFDVRGELVQPLFQPRAFLLQLDFLRGKLFQAHDVALFLQIERVDFVADARELLRAGKSIRLGLAQLLLLLDQLALDRAQSRLAGLQRLSMPLQRTRGGSPPIRCRGQFLLRRPTPFFRLRDVVEGVGVLLLNFQQPFLVEMDAALVPVRLALQLQRALL